MKRLSYILLCLFLLGISYDGYSQIRKRQIKRNNKKLRSFKGRKNTFTSEKRYNYIGVSVNALNYFGDITPLPNRLSTDMSFTKPGFGITFGHRFGPFYTLTGTFMYGTISGSDFTSADPNVKESADNYVRNLHFRNRIKELSIVAKFDLLKNKGSYISRVQFTPYVYLGATLFHHNPQAIAPEGTANPGEWVDLQPLGTEGQFANEKLAADHPNRDLEPYKRIQVAIPLGIGIRYRLNQVMDLSIESGVRYTFTDYLDDVSANFVDLNALDGDLARAMSYRVDETTDALSGEQRELSGEFVSNIMSQRYSNGIVAGYGDQPTDIRGDRKDNDVYFVTTVRVSFIIGARFRRAKFR